MSIFIPVMGGSVLLADLVLLSLVFLKKDLEMIPPIKNNY
jgi:hypothetical protein